MINESMNLYEFEGKRLFEKQGIKIPRGIVVKRDGEVPNAFSALGGEVLDVVVKAQVLSGKRGKNNAIRFCSSQEEVESAVKDLFAMEVRGQYVAAVWIEEKLDIAEEHYLSITYDTNAKQPVLVYSAEGGVDIEDVDDTQIMRVPLDIRDAEIEVELGDRQQTTDNKVLAEICNKLWKVFLQEDCRQVEINPLVKTAAVEWYAADAKVAIDDDAFFRHSSGYIERQKEKGKDVSSISNWEEFEPRTMLGRPATEREIAVAEIDKGEKYYQGTAGKYIEMDGDIALMLIGGGASIANMDAMKDVGLKAANYTEYSGNPPREKVYELTKLVLSKPGIRGLWMCGVVSNFTNVRDTFQGFADALDEIKPTYPIVIRRAGPFDKEGMQLMRECAQRNNLNIKLFGKEVSMGETASVLAEMVNT
jgi:citryl-CoA synthetase large subunit